MTYFFKNHILYAMITNNKMYAEAVDIVSNVDHVLVNERISTLDSKSLYDFAEKLERARNLMLTLGDRTYREERKVADVGFTEIF